MKKQVRKSGSEPRTAEARARRSESIVPSPIEALRALVERELPKVEKTIRKFQDELAAINTDAAYEVKVACDVFGLNVRTGVVTRLLSEMESPDYQPCEFCADVLAGRIADLELPLLPDEKPKPKSEGRCKVAVDNPINVSEPIASRK